MADANQEPEAIPADVAPAVDATPPSPAADLGEPGDGPGAEETNLARRRFFRQFAGEIFQTAATVAGAAQALQRASAEAAGAILDPVGAENRLAANAIAAEPAGADGRPAPPTGFRTPFREDNGLLYLIDQRKLLQRGGCGLKKT